MFANTPKKSKIFISYARSDKAEAEQLDDRLRIGGLPTWRDLKDSKKGVPLETQIEAALRDECSMFLMYLTPRACKSDYINKIEVKLARDLWTKNQLTIVPIFHGVSPADAAKAVQAHLGFDISPFDGMVLPPPMSKWKWIIARLAGDQNPRRKQLAEPFSELARRLLETQLKSNDTSADLSLRLHTYEYSAGETLAEVELDWSPLLRSGMNGWNTILMPALYDVRHAITTARSGRQLTIHGGGHLSAGLILGHTFSSASGFALVIKQNGTSWSSQTNGIQQQPLTRAEELGSPSQSDIALEISISNDIGGAVDGFMRKRPGMFRKRVKLTLVGGPSRQGVRDQAHANSIAAQIFQEIRAVRQDPNLKTVHIFLSAPFAVAVLIGHLFNACGPLQMYEFEKMKNEYVPSFMVGTGGTQ